MLTEHDHTKPQNLFNLEQQSEDLKTVVSQDISRYINQFNDEKIGIRLFSTKVGIHERTIARLISKENKPNYGTLYKLYRVLLDAKDDSELYERCPKIVQNEIKRFNPKPIQTNITYTTSFESELKRCPVFSEIYFLSTAGKISRGFISYKFGAYGEDILEKMLEMKALVPSSKEKDLFYPGPVQANISAELIKSVGLHFTKSYSKPENSDENGKNFSAFFIEGLTESALNEWLKIDEEAFRKKIKLIQEPSSRGDLKVFTFMTTDTATTQRKKI